ncbi:rubrerythrin family protein [Devosia sp. XJ19-1]|uniref:Rubrerythrin family protein n=1 Tax=Devosia ureilytica TaxID=2952754 RepID=A0A9Q4AMI9_9HYPH|nr:ferritin family protein [Devosia ureilytica]MCP8883280.1 rubrerythrin family protein [Devosia ureilytica]MCP8886352.1 rubrerythrin family protein [Devosia ureilytica]
MLRLWPDNRRDFSSLSEREILSLAVAAEEEDGRIYSEYATRLGETYPGSAALFEGMAAEEDEHRQRLLDLYISRFGKRLVPIRREHVRGFLTRKPVWLQKTLTLDQARQQVWEMEEGAYRFYLEAAKQVTDASIRKLLGDLAAAEKGHAKRADQIDEDVLGEAGREAEGQEAHRQFLLTYVQPGLAGLMDGSVSTLAPVFAAAFATGDTHQTFLVGLAAAVGAGISMGFTEAASDDGKLTGRGSPIKRGFAAGIMTAVGGLGHALPYLIADFFTATAVAVAVVLIELWAIAFIQQRYMQTPFWRAVMQVVLGGSLVFAAGILIGNA